MRQGSEDIKDPFEKLKEEFATSYLIDKYIKSSKHYIPPKSVKIPPNYTGQSRSFQYVSIVEIVKKIVSQPGFKEISAHRHIEEKIILQDITDGQNYQSNPFFLENPDALGILLASDEFDPCNALGPSRGLHKTLNVYATLVEIPKKHRLALIDFSNWRLEKIMFFHCCTVAS